jgi:signal transduction histidine kinase
MLHEFLTEHRAEIITRCRAKVAARSVPEPTQAELEHGVPLFLDQLAEILRLESGCSSGIRDSAARHGDELLRLGFTVGQVVHGYGDICQSVTELALEWMVPITTPEFRTLNECLDEAIANAVTEYGHQRDQRMSQEATERLGVFAHELRNLVNTVALSFEALSHRRVGIDVSIGALFGRSLSRLRGFVDRSLASVRLEAGIQTPERIAVAEFIDDVEVSAAIEARARGIRLTVGRTDGDVAVEADRQILASVVANLLQNAFKFTRSGGRVSLRTFADADRVLIEVADECGGLPPGDPNGLLRPYEQRGCDRTGLGLGLAISRRGVEASGGVFRVRDLPGTGCVFTIDLPQAVRLEAPPSPEGEPVPHTHMRGAWEGSRAAGALAFASRGT